MNIRRKRVYVLMSFLLCLQIMMAQELRVKSFRQAEGDITARSEPRNDINGDPCALIKVHIPDELIKVEGAYVEPITSVGMEKRIYVPTVSGSGATSLILYTAHHQPLKIVYADSIAKTLTARCTYELNIVETSSGSHDFGGQYLVMSRTPAEATVTIDGLPTPHDADGTMQVLLAYGSHNYTVSAPGYESKSGTFEVNHDKVSLSVVLQSVMSTLSVTCPTSGCGIYLNDKQVGTDNWKGTMVAGTYNVEARKENYRSSSQVVTLQQKENKEIRIPALSALTGQLNVSYKPTNAEVYIDGTKAGTSPDIFRDIMLGSHRVEIRKSGYESAQLNVTVKENAVSDVTGSLKQSVAASSSSSSSVSSSGGYSSSSSSSSTSSVLPVTVKGVTFKMVKVEGGTFTMGATSEQVSDAYDVEMPVHQVTLSSYYIGETEVTQALWTAVMGSNPSKCKGENKPVENVSWKDCQKFISRLNSQTGKNFSLPTEAQWEYAARGGRKSQGNKYSGSGDIGNVAWYSDNSSSSTHDVRTKSANELGLYDMSGNVWEWCSDRYGSYSSDSQTNPTGADSSSYRVYRGGSWYCYSRGCRVSDRSDDTPGSRDAYIGLRLALVVL